MEQPIYAKLAALAATEEAEARSVSYIQSKLKQFLKRNERVLICFSRQDDTCCRILEQAVTACDCTPIWVGEDRRWITILKTAFTSKCNCIIGPPLLLLGLSKVARHMGTPLFARNVLSSGYPSPDWMIEAIERGLDCRAWGCYDPGVGAVISGFSCADRRGVHIRDEEYLVQIVDEQNRPLPDGEKGFVVVQPKAAPELRYKTGDVGLIDRSKCPCGCESPRLVELDNRKDGYEGLSAVGESLHYWSSVLDCRLQVTECGLELEAVVFQGEKLPKFPSCAKMVIRAWNPETDEPFNHHMVLKNRLTRDFSH